ncbi:MAG: DUF262 domain-containing protein [Lachnospiraceae bacterium]|nr:DUF262 domain-containing protein [Lachnospiraceae bacterium]
MKKICNKEMMKFGGLSEMDYDDFYSRVGLDVSLARESFDPTRGKTFKEYVCGVIKLSVWKEMKHRNCGKRQVIVEKEITDSKGNIIIEKEYIPTASLDAPIGDGKMIGDTIQSGFDIDNTLSETTNCGYSDKMETFLESLPETPRKIAEMIMSGYSVEDIKENLGLTDREYRDYWKIICSYEKKRVLYEENNNVEDDEMNTTILTEDVAESYKNTSYSIDSISKQLQKKRIRDDHILQRHSGQWKGFAKSELISDILRGKSLTQIIISEEIKNGLRMQWLIDGKQRCTTLDDFLHDGFPISKNVKNYNIRYQTTKVDEDGFEVLNEDGFTEMEFKEFDIRNKKFSQLPEELQEIFKDRQIPVLYNMNCTKKDIADDIARFNRSRPMNVAQNGWLGLEESFAELVGNISKMQFFQKDFNGTAYTLANHTSGAIRRIIVEAIMVSDFIEEFKEFDKMCEFLSEEASDSNFTEFYSLIERLTVICDERVSKMFNTTDSFLWLGLFSKFTELGLDDKKFIDFMVEFETNMKDIKVDVSYDGVNKNSFNTLCINPKTKKSRATKDKNMVIAKMTLLENLMMKYLHINEEDLEEVDYKEFVKTNVEDIIDEDIDDIQVVANDISEELDEDSWMLSEQNYPSYFAIVGLAFRKEVEDKLKEWIKIYIKNNQFILNQQKAFLHMKKSFENYLQKGAVA